jgi:hypothetical protein
MSNTILINLQESDQAKDYSDEHLVHATEFEIMSKHLKELTKLAETSPNKDNLHNAVTVLGTRGSGKTSFLLSTHEYVKKNLENVEVLDIIDPTLIEEKGHVFLNVISAISARIEDELMKGECQPSKEPHYTRKDWRQKLLKLAAGIPSIDGVGSINMESWQDAEFIMDSGLIAVKAARDLKKNFNTILEFALKVLDKKAFVITFDDIDVDSTKGWAILECIRKYFTSSRLILIVSGDPNLYLSVIRQKKWTNFGSEILKYEGTHWKQEDGTNEKLSAFNDLVTDLTAQYMLKIMPPKYRIHLTTLQEKMNSDMGLEIKVIYKDKDIDSRIEVLYNQILGALGFHNELQLEVYRTFLMNLPLRTQIQFLLTMRLPKPVDRINTSDSEDVKAGERENNDPSNIRNIEDTEKVSANITDVFLADLQEKKVDTLVASKIPKFLNTIILKLLVKERRLSDLYQLQPVTTDHSLNASLFSLNISLADTIAHQQSFLVFDYFMRVAFSRNVADSIPYEQKSKAGRNDLYLPTIDDLCVKTGLYNDIVLRDTIASVQGYICGALDLSDERYNNYFIRLHGLKDKARRPLLDRLDSVFTATGISEVQKTLGHIPGFSLYLNNSSIVCYSVYVLIATIGEIVKRDETVNRGKSDEDRKKEIRTALSSLSQLRAYPIVEFANTTIPDKQSKLKTEEAIEDEETDVDLNSDDDAIIGENPTSEEISKNEGENEQVNAKKEEVVDDPQGQLIDWVFNWLNADVKNTLAVAPHLLGKIFTRFHFAVKNIMDQRPKIGLGDLMYLQIVTFFNSIIIEESLERLNNAPGLNLSNTSFSSRFLRENLNKIDENTKAKLPLSRWLLSCPLLIPYLNKQDTKLNNALLNFGGTQLRDYLNISVKNLLDYVTIFGRSKPNENTSPLEYRVYPASDDNQNLTRKGNEHELIKILRREGYPKKWFVTSDSTTDYRNNKEIRKYLSSIFGENNHTSIRNFRKYLTENQDLWK